MSTEFLIKISQQMAGDNAVTELQKTEQALKAAMDGYKDLERAALGAGKSLERSTTQVASIQTKMNDAMAKGDGAAFWKLAGALDKAKASQTQLAAAADKAQHALKVQEFTVRDLADSVSGLKRVERAEKEIGSAASTAARKVDKLGDELGQVSKFDLQSTAGGIKKLGGPLGGAGDKVEEFSESWEALSGSLGKGGAVFAVAAAAVAAVTVALAAGAAMAAKYAISVANVKRQTNLTLEAMFRTPSAARDISSAFVRIQKETGVTSDRMLELTRDLKEAGLSSSQIPKALKAIAQQESALGDTSGTSKLVEQLKSGEKSVEQMASEMEKQFGDIARKKALGLDQQLEQLKANVANLFEGFDIEGILKGMSKLVAFFDGTTSSGKALRVLLGGMFGPMAKGASVFTMIERLMYQTLNAGLRLGIQIKKTAKLFDFGVPGLDGIPIASAAATVAIATLTPAIMAVQAVILTLVATVSIMSSMWATMSGLGVAAWSAITGAVDGAIAKLEGIDLSEIGTAMIDGLVGAIESGGKAVAEAVTGVAEAAIESAKDALGIASPSKEFAWIGEQTVAGFSGAVNDNAPDAMGAMEALVEPPSATRMSAAGGGFVIHATFNISGGGDHDAIAAAIREELERMMANAAAQHSAPAVEAA